MKMIWRACVATVVAAVPLLQSSAVAAATVINVDTKAVAAPIDRRILGANEVWPLGMAGALDLKTFTVEPSFDVALREASITTLRYPGGTVGNLFHWQRAIGPQSQRIGQTSTTTVPFDNVFGPDEYGRMLDTYKMSGNIVVNFATGTAQEAADWVEYMTAKVGNDARGFAKLRAQNGHPDPYPIDYWELGNEIAANSGSYWLGGTPTAYDIARNCTTSSCRYTFGGFGHFNNQAVGAFNDFTAARSLSTGAASQTLFIQYPPVVASSVSVTVGTETWNLVSSLSGQGKVYTLDAASGAIRFGDGSNGAIPPSGTKITVSYDSGPHDGFVQFYDAIKAVNPNARVCSALGLNGDPYFIANAPKYDCIVSHPYISGPAATVPLINYHPMLMLAANDAAAIVTALKAQIAPYQPKAEVIITEYGHLGGGGASDFPTHFHLSLSEGLFTANAVMRWAALNQPFAQRHRLVDWVFTPLPPGAANVGASDNSMIAGPAPFIAEPQAKVFGLFSRTMGTARLQGDIVENPLEVGSWGQLPVLQVLPTKWDDGTIGIIVVNQSATIDVGASLNPQNLIRSRAVDILTVNGPAITSYNTPDNPRLVDLVPTRIDVGHVGAFPYLFPAHSVTGFRFTPAQPSELIDEQIALLGSTGSGGRAISFNAQLNAMNAEIASGNIPGACAQLSSYLVHLKAQTGLQIAPSRANTLLYNASLIGALLTCPL